MTGVVVRRIGPSEARAWRAIRLLALRDAPGAFAAKHDEWAARPIADFEAQCRDEAVLLAFRGATPIGSAVWTGDPDVPDRAWLEAVYLAPDARGQGVGQALIAAAIADAGKAGKAEMWLEVAAESHEAQTAYSRAGFAAAELPEGRRRCAKDDLAMCRTL